MDFKKLFRKDDKAVSPVIGVILMVAITVILAAAIGSSVFSHGAAQAAPQANLNIKPYGTYSSSGTDVAVVKLEHLGGDTINLDETSTKILISLNDGQSEQYTAYNLDSSSTDTLNIGDIKKFSFKDIPDSGTPANITVKAGEIAHIKFIDINSGQIYFDKDITF
ncbi:hypothetical protein MSKOL_0498 [Methanosarcina sp. Kolksee]|uniref:type IV pilin n=1 Tax=Methanosarcina sp. Kolksee TaxID=1434099 RepID=UPI000615AD99|nr:type IV pilin [Methanosarcina sp. Kolksee]AKB46275.1 hypothetical protein MSKOL_0498 [Methanosarcina sp. Kolksee]